MYTLSEMKARGEVPTGLVFEKGNNVEWLTFRAGLTIFFSHSKRYLDSTLNNLLLTTALTLEGIDAESRTGRNAYYFDLGPEGTDGVPSMIQHLADTFGDARTAERLKSIHFRGGMLTAKDIIDHLSRYECKEVGIGGVVFIRGLENVYPTAEAQLDALRELDGVLSLYGVKVVLSLSSTAIGQMEDRLDPLTETLINVTPYKDGGKPQDYILFSLFKRAKCSLPNLGEKVGRCLLEYRKGFFPSSLEKKGLYNKIFKQMGIVVAPRVPTLEEFAASSPINRVLAESADTILFAVPME